MSADDVSAGGLNAAGEIKIQGVVCGQVGCFRDSMKLTGKRIQEQNFGFVLCRTVLYRCWPQRYHFCSDSHQIPNNMERVVVSPISYVYNWMAPRMKRVSENHMKTMGVLLSNLNNCLLTNIPLQSNVLQEIAHIFWWFVSILCRLYIYTFLNGSPNFTPTHLHPTHAAAAWLHMFTSQLKFASSHNPWYFHRFFLLVWLKVRSTKKSVDYIIVHHVPHWGLGPYAEGTREAWLQVTEKAPVL